MHTSYCYLANTILAAVWAIVTCLWAQAPAYGDMSQRLRLETEHQRTAQALFLEIFSPFCPGRSLQDCPSPQASELKDEIRELLGQGRSRQEIMQVIVERFGPGARSKPPTQGFGWAAWLAPPLFFAIGVLTMASILRKKKRSN